MSNCAVFFNTMRTEQKTSVKNSIGRLVFVGISVLLQVIWIINLFLWLNPLFSGNFPFFHADRSLSCLCNIRNAWKYGI